MTFIAGVAPIDVTPIPELQQFLAADTVLSGLLPAGWWEDPMPDDHKADPGGVIKLQAPSDETLCMGSRVTEFFLEIEGVGPAVHITDIRMAGLRIDELMVGRLGVSGDGLLGGYHVLLCERSEPVSYNDSEVETGIRYEHRGGIYRLLVSTR